MKLVVGLGNHGKEYELTRHNLGFIVLDNFTKRIDIKLGKRKFNAYYNIHEDIIFVKPYSYMNLSGQVVKKFIDFYDIAHINLIVIHDDVDIEFGRLKIKFGGGSAGHKGIISIINEIDSSDFIRLRVGIAKPQNNAVIKHVLEPFNKIELKLLNKDIIDRSINALNLILTKGYEKAANEINGCVTNNAI